MADRVAPYSYGMECQLRQKGLFKNRYSNHWKHRIRLAKSLMSEYGFSRLGNKDKESIVVADLACSIGTFAIEFAKMGYSSYGIDFDHSAIEIAKELAEEEGVNPTFSCKNLLSLDWNMPPIDVAICFDIFEHLHNDQLGALLLNLKLKMSQKSVLIFHTFPTRYDYIFYTNRKWYRPLLPFRNFKSSTFSNITRAYGKFIDIILLAKSGLTYTDAISNAGHCNPLTLERLNNIFIRASYDVLFIDSGQLYQTKKRVRGIFSEQPIANRHIYGVATPNNSIMDVLSN